MCTSNDDKGSILYGIQENRITSKVMMKDHLPKSTKIIIIPNVRHEKEFMGLCVPMYHECMSLLKYHMSIHVNFTACRK